MSDYLKELVGFSGEVGAHEECPECGYLACTFDHDAEVYDPKMVNDPSMWPPWWTLKDAQKYHSEMMVRKAKLDEERGEI